LLAVLVTSALVAQVAEQPVVLTIDVENAVIYRGTVFDASKLAKDPGPTTSVNQAFVEVVNVGDIVAVNGKPAKGLWSCTVYAMPYRQAPLPGQPIADFDLGGGTFCSWTIFSPEGTPVGMITDTGPAAGGVVTGHLVTGGLLGFFGVIGEQRIQTITASRQASTAEDPANRRNLGGGTFQATFYLYPKFRPTIMLTQAGPGVFHADFSLVTSANPARKGEVLIIRATGLGPVKPDLTPPGSVRFASDPVQEVNSPVDVVFNGKELAAINKIGWPGETDIYRLDFRVPDGATAGMAAIQLTAAWIAGSSVNIPIQ
jgi:uncharacterized protein (TIGR03437 family)